MNIQKITISAGAALAVLLPIAAPAMGKPAEQSEELVQEQLVSQRSGREQVVSGKIVEIVGDVVKLSLDNGRAGIISMCWQERGAQGIVVGMRISATLEGRSIVAMNREVITSQRIASSSLLQRVRQVRRQLQRTQRTPQRTQRTPQRTQRTPQRSFTTPPQQRIPQVPQRVRPQVPALTVPQAPASRPVRALW
ncbi:MAG: hypothetical protein EBE86_029190 [Hormoscilla sp. GUM202]|nr:hypothetical protein [Hormoscilla sp. GUM202]